MNRLWVVRIIPPTNWTTPTTKLRSVSSLSKPVVRSAGKFLAHTNGKCCIQHSGKWISGISFTQYRFASAGSRIPKKFQRKLLPFEVEINKISNQDTILFSQPEKDKLYKLMTFGGVFMFFVLLNAADLLTTLRVDVEPQKKEEVAWFAWWRKVDLASKKSLLASGFIFIALVYLSGVLFWTTRMVRQITLLKGGQNILFETHKPFGRFKKVEIPLENFSANWANSRGQYLWVRVKSKWFSYGIDTDGHIPVRGMLDKTIGQKRF